MHAVTPLAGWPPSFLAVDRDRLARAGEAPVCCVTQDELVERREARWSDATRHAVLATPLLLVRLAIEFEASSRDLSLQIAKVHAESADAALRRGDEDGYRRARNACLRALERAEAAALAASHVALEVAA